MVSISNKGSTPDFFSYLHAELCNNFVSDTAYDCCKGYSLQMIYGLRV